MTTKICATASYPASRRRNETILEYVDRELDDCSSFGELEGLKVNVEKTRCAIGRLLQTLADKKLLDAPEITEIVTGDRRQGAYLSP